MLVARATMGLFWASNFADDEKRFHVMVGLSGKRRGERAHNKREDNIQEGSHLIFFIYKYIYSFSCTENALKPKESLPLS